MTQNTQIEAKLAPCPFCGSAGNPKVFDFDGEPYVPGYEVRCDASGWEGMDERGCGASSGWGETPAEAIAAWNRRALREAPVPSEEPVAWRGVVAGRTAFLCRTRDEIDRLASDYNATIEPLGVLASPAVAPVAPAAVLDKLLSCVCLLEVMADSAKERDDEVEWAMMSVMAKDGREVLNGYQSE